MLFNNCFAIFRAIPCEYTNNPCLNPYFLFNIQVLLPDDVLFNSGHVQIDAKVYLTEIGRSVQIS